MIKPTPASTLLALALVALWLLGRYLGLSAEELLAAIATIVGIVGGALHRAKPPSRGSGPGALVVPFILLCLPSCATERPACSPAALAAIEASYVAEALRVCDGYTAETCPELPAIRETYHAKRSAWEACR